MSISNLLISCVGFASMVIGIGLNWGVGWALLVAGAILFAAGGVGSAREGQ